MITILRDLFGDFADIYPSSLENGSIRDLRKCDLYLCTCTSHELMQDEWTRPYFPPEELMVQYAITFTKQAIQTLKAYPAGTKAVLSNQNRHMALECWPRLGEEQQAAAFALIDQM